MQNCNRENENRILLTNIQRFSLHDGPGIRTTVFLKGCSLRCPWCCNPENMEYRIQSYEKNGVMREFGKWYDVDKLYAEVMKDEAFYVVDEEWGIALKKQENDRSKNSYLENYQILKSIALDSISGGITFSGGEALLQAKALKPLWERLNMKGIHMAVETALFVPEENLKMAIEYIDLFLVDIKILNENRCQEMIKGNLEVYERNLSLLLDSCKPIILRVPVIKGYTDDEENMEAVCEKIKYCRVQSTDYSRNNILKIEIINGHNLGDEKYNTLSLSSPDSATVSYEFMEKYKCRIENYAKDIIVECCKV